MGPNPLHVSIWGIKQQFQVFTFGPELNASDTIVRSALQDIRSQIKYQSVDLDFYSVAWVEGFEVFSAYTALYDWSNRKGGYVAISLFVPIGKRIVGGAAALLDRLMGMYKDQYVDADWKIKQVKEDPAPFLQAVESAWMVEEVRPERTMASSGVGYVRFKLGSISKHLENPYREEFDGFERVFFLPEGQERLRPAPTVRQIKLLGFGTEMARPVTYSVSIKPTLPEGAAAAAITVQINGVTVSPDVNGVYTRAFLSEQEMVSVMVASEGCLPLVETRSVKQWGARVGVLSLQKVSVPPPSPKKPSRKERTATALPTVNTSDAQAEKAPALDATRPEAKRVTPRDRPEIPTTQKDGSAIKERPAVQGARKKLSLLILGVFLVCLCGYGSLVLWQNIGTEGIRDEDRNALLAKVDSLYSVNTEKVRALSDEHLAMLDEFKTVIDTAEVRGLSDALIDRAKSIYAGSLKYFSESNDLFEIPKAFANHTIDTSMVYLPTVARLDSLFFRASLSNFRNREAREGKAVTDLMNELISALDRKAEEDKEAESAKARLQENARIATRIANEAKLYTGDVYRKYIQWCTLGPTNNTAFNARNERYRVLSKLKLMREISNLDYLSRTNSERFLKSIDELMQIQSDSRLTRDQKKMVKRRIDYIMEKPPI